MLDDAALTNDASSIEALFKEARQRRRKRRRTGVAIAIASALAIAGVLYGVDASRGGSGGGLASGSEPGPSAPSGPEFNQPNDIPSSWVRTTYRADGLLVTLAHPPSWTPRLPAQGFHYADTWSFVANFPLNRNWCVHGTSSLTCIGKNLGTFPPKGLLMTLGTGGYEPAFNAESQGLGPGTTDHHQRPRCSADVGGCTNAPSARWWSLPGSWGHWRLGRQGRRRSTPGRVRSLVLLLRPQRESARGSGASGGGNPSHSIRPVSALAALERRARLRTSEQTRGMTFRCVPGVADHRLEDLARLGHDVRVGSGGIKRRKPHRPLARLKSRRGNPVDEPPVMWPEAFEADPFSPAGEVQGIWRLTGGGSDALEAQARRARWPIGRVGAFVLRSLGLVRTSKEENPMASPHRPQHKRKLSGGGNDR